MTNRVNGLLVSLDKDYRDDDVEAIVYAIKMIKGVIDVEANVVDANDYLNKSRLKYQTRNKLIKAVHEIFED